MSKIANPLGGIQSHKRLQDWETQRRKDEKEITEEMMINDFFLMPQFLKENPDLYNSENPFNVTLHSLDNIKSSDKIFWILPTNEIEEKIYTEITHNFGENSKFLKPEKFKAFPLGDSIIYNKPLIKINGNFYCFSLLLTYRNIFSILSSLLEKADLDYFKSTFTGNSSSNSKDNYLESKTKEVFEKLIPEAQFYLNLEYSVEENGVIKKTELDILGESDKAIYIIEVKAGELNKKHRRGALKGLKQRLDEIINMGSYQCERAKKHIESQPNPQFKYAANETSHILEIDKSKKKEIFKITITFEQLGFISANLKILVNNGVLNPDYKWSWITSIYDLMIFAELIENEVQFIEYLKHRLELYDREDIRFFDEIDLLEYFLENTFPIPIQEANKILIIDEGSKKIDEYFDKKVLGFPINPKPQKTIDNLPLIKPKIIQKKNLTNQIKKKNKKKASKKSKRANRKRKK